MQSSKVNTKSKSGATQAHSLKMGRHVIGLTKHEYVINSMCRLYTYFNWREKNTKSSFRKSRESKEWCEYLYWAIHPTIQTNHT